MMDEKDIDIRLNCKGRLKKGVCAPIGEILIEEEDDGSYYLYLWPNDGSAGELEVFDSWLMTYKLLKEEILDNEWEIEWQEDKPVQIDDINPEEKERQHKFFQRVVEFFRNHPNRAKD